MTIEYYNENGRVQFSTDRRKPKAKGKFIAGWADSVEQVRESVAKYLGGANFDLIEVDSFSWHNVNVDTPASAGCVPRHVRASDSIGPDGEQDPVSFEYLYQLEDNFIKIAECQKSGDKTNYVSISWIPKKVIELLLETKNPILRIGPDIQVLDQISASKVVQKWVPENLLSQSLHHNDESPCKE